jgi:hypothetical protein
MVVAHTLGAWPALRGSNSSGFLLRKNKSKGARDQLELAEFTKEIKHHEAETETIKSDAGAVQKTAQNDLLIDLGLELLEPDLQALDGVHALHYVSTEKHRRSVRVRHPQKD